MYAIAHMIEDAMNAAGESLGGTTMLISAKTPAI
jgi:hypothetical protein